jgi:uncharacterized protein YidB (DUF937 family)
MFDVLIREAAARFGLGDKALALIQMLLARMTNPETGGLIGFLDQFKAAGCGPIVQSWLGGGPAAQPIGNSQVENALGASGGLLAELTERLELPRDNVTSALGYLLPNLVGKLTPGGNAPSSVPAEIATLAAAGKELLAAPVTAAADGGSSGKWLFWVLLALAVLIGLVYFTQNPASNATPPAPAAAPASAPAATGMAPALPSSTPASQPD